MAQAFKLTADTITPAKGMYALIPNIPHSHNNIFYSAEPTDTIAAGDFVKLSTTSTNTACPVMEKCAVTDVPDGMVVYNCRVAEYKVGEKFAVAETGDCVWLVANGEIAVGAKLQFTADGYVDDTTTSTNAYIGVAQTKANAKGDYVKVKLNFGLGKAS